MARKKNKTSDLTEYGEVLLRAYKDTACHFASSFKEHYNPTQFLMRVGFSSVISALCMPIGQMKKSDLYEIVYFFIYALYKEIEKKPTAISAKAMKALGILSGHIPYDKALEYIMSTVMHNNVEYRKHLLHINGKLYKRFVTAYSICGCNPYQFIENFRSCYEWNNSFFENNWYWDSKDEVIKLLDELTLDADVHNRRCQYFTRFNKENILFKKSSGYPTYMDSKDSWPSITADPIIFNTDLRTIRSYELMIDVGELLTLDSFGKLLFFRK